MSDKDVARVFKSDTPYWFVVETPWNRVEYPGEQLAINQANEINAALAKEREKTLEALCRFTCAWCDSGAPVHSQFGLKFFHIAGNEREECLAESTRRFMGLPESALSAPGVR